MRKRFLAVMLAAMLLGFGLSVPVGVWLVERTSPAYAAPQNLSTCNGGLIELTVTTHNTVEVDVNGDGIICAKDNQLPKKQ